MAKLSDLLMENPGEVKVTRRGWPDECAILVNRGVLHPLCKGEPDDTLFTRDDICADDWEKVE